MFMNPCVRHEDLGSKIRILFFCSREETISQWINSQKEGLEEHNQELVLHLGQQE